MCTYCTVEQYTKTQRVFSQFQTTSRLTAGMGEAVTALKEPRGFLRCLELLFSIIAVATLTNYSSHMAFEIKCKEQTIPARLVGTSFSYPFR